MKKVDLGKIFPTTLQKWKTSQAAIAEQQYIERLLGKIMTPKEAIPWELLF